jgi:hypothetical protein
MKLLTELNRPLFYFILISAESPAEQGNGNAGTDAVGQ